MAQKQSIPVLLGATASGKTSIGIELAKQIQGEVISVDSRKVYRGLKIGTATPNGSWIAGQYIVNGIPHYLMGHTAPEQPYSAGRFVEEASAHIESILKRGKKPILVGGTGFYFKALQRGLPPLPQRNPALRSDLGRLIQRKGLSFLHDRLKERDPRAAQNISPRDRHKLIRATEVHQLTGQPYSYWKNKGSTPSPYSFVVFGVRFPKDELEKRIEDRSKKMLKEGMIEETKRLMEGGVLENAPALCSFGYKEAVDVLRGRLAKAEFLLQLIQGTKAYAKRQHTWFKTQVHPSWFEINSNSNELEIALKMKSFLQTI